MTEASPSATEAHPRILRILLADDHAILREGLRRLLEAEPDFQVVGEASDGREAIERASELRPDIVVMDISMPAINGVAAAQRLKSLDPAVSVLVLTVHEEKGYLRELFQAGASGYLLKRSASGELIRALRSLAAGATYIDPHLSGKLINALLPGKEDVATGQASLSDRESEVLRLIAIGHSNKEIAAKLDVSVKTIETYKARAMEKLHLRSRVDIVAHAAEEGWLPRNSL